MPVIRQLFIVEEERLKGYATLLVKYFVEENCNLEDEIWFDVESPNEASYSLLEKSGYIKIQGDKIVKTRIGFVQSGI
jgi:hypothetical protein